MLGIVIVLCGGLSKVKPASTCPIPRREKKPHPSAEQQAQRPTPNYISLRGASFLQFLGGSIPPKNICVSNKAVFPYDCALFLELPLFLLPTSPPLLGSTALSSCMQNSNGKIPLNKANWAANGPFAIYQRDILP